LPLVKTADEIDKDLLENDALKKRRAGKPDLTEQFKCESVFTSCWWRETQKASF
jgi:hypothetical protein